MHLLNELGTSLSCELCCADRVPNHFVRLFGAHHRAASSFLRRSRERLLPRSPLHHTLDTGSLVLRQQSWRFRIVGVFSVNLIRRGV